MSATDDVVDRHIPAAAELAGIGAAPSLRIAALTCMDTRIDVYRALRLDRGEAHVLRNGGGVVTDDVIRSLAISQHKLGTREVVVIQHTSCGMTSMTNDGFAAELRAATGLSPTWAVEAFTDVRSSVRQSIERVRRSPFLAGTESVRGFVYDVEADTLTEVDASG